MKKTFKTINQAKWQWNENILWTNEGKVVLLVESVLDPMLEDRQTQQKTVNYGGFRVARYRVSFSCYSPYKYHHGYNGIHTRGSNAASSKGGLGQ